MRQGVPEQSADSSAAAQRPVSPSAVQPAEVSGALSQEPADVAAVGTPFCDGRRFVPADATKVSASAAAPVLPLGRGAAGFLA